MEASGPLKVAFVYVSPANEEGWSSQHDKGRQAVEKHFGDKIKVTWLENIPENADAERVIRDLASQGNKLIFATSFGYMNSLMKVAKEFPDVIFEHATGYKTDKNVTNYTARFYESRYLAGKLAGATTKTNILGYVACQAAYDHCAGWLDQVIGLIDTNRKLVVDFFAKELPQIKVFDLEATYLLWMDWRGLGIDYRELERRNHEEAKVFFDEGYVFGAQGEGFERWNLACPTRYIEEALQRIKAVYA